MIEVKYDRRHLTVTVTGHAKSDEPGKDLVCAAATILTYTLAGNAESLAEDHSKFHHPKITLEEGNASIRVRPIGSMRAVAAVILDAICAGYDILQKQYPQYVLYEVQG